MSINKKQRAICKVVGHKWKFISRTGDWLFGGTYFYECTRCGTPKTSTPYLP